MCEVRTSIALVLTWSTISRHSIVLSSCESNPTGMSEGCPTCQNSDGHRWVDPVDEGCAIYLHLFFRMTAVVRSWLRCIVFVQKFREDNLEWETSSTRISISSENLDELKPLIEAEGQQVWNQGSKMSSCQWAAKAIISSQISKRSVQWSMNSKPFLETENEH